MSQNLTQPEEIDLVLQAIADGEEPGSDWSAGTAQMDSMQTAQSERKSGKASPCGLEHMRGFSVSHGRHC